MSAQKAAQAVPMSDAMRLLIAACSHRQACRPHPEGARPAPPGHGEDPRVHREPAEGGGAARCRREAR
eukprot:8194283-Pyramimonas_sp.AAC.1